MNDYIFVIFILAFFLASRWILFVGPRWGRKLFCYSIFVGLISLARLSPGSPMQILVGVLLGLVFFGFGLWVFKYVGMVLYYVFRLFRGILKKIKNTADDLVGLS